MRRPIFKLTLYETSQIWPICHFIYKEFFFWFLSSKQNTWTTIQGIIIYRIPEPWFSLWVTLPKDGADDCRCLLEEKEMTTDVIRFFFCFDKVSVPVFIGKYYVMIMCMELVQIRVLSKYICKSSDDVCEVSSGFVIRIWIRCELHAHRVTNIA